MELLDRYLYAVGRYLPKDRREDILAELRANILSQVEDREEELGRPLTLDEQEAVLKQHGHPMLVAARYQPQQYLIGPAIFPVYWHVLQLAFPWVALLYALAHAAEFLFQPVTFDRVLETVMGFVPVAFFTASLVTLAFAMMEYATTRYAGNLKGLYAWNPRNLPKPEPETKRRPNPIFDFIANLFALVFLLMVRQYPFLVLGPGIFYRKMFRPAPIWLAIYEIAIVFVSIQLVITLIAVFSPMVRRWQIVVDLTKKASAIVIISFLLRANEYVVLGPDADIEKFQNVVQALNDAMRLCWKVVIVVLSLQLLWELGKLAFPRSRVNATPPHFEA